MRITEKRQKLIKEFKEGNVDAFLELADGCKSILNIMCDKYNSTSITIDKDDIEQIFYESILELIHTKITDDNCKYFNSYLNQMTDRKISSIIKKNEKEQCTSMNINDILEERFQEFISKYSFNCSSFEDSLINSFLHDEIIELMNKKLTERERSITMKYFGFFGDEDISMRVLGEEYGVTADRIHQIIAKSLRKMRYPSVSKYLRPYMYEDNPFHSYTRKDDTHKTVSDIKDKNDRANHNFNTNNEKCSEKEVCNPSYEFKEDYDKNIRDSLLNREFLFNRVFQNIVKEVVEIELINNGDERRLWFDQEKAIIIFDYIGLEVPDDLMILINTFINLLNSEILKNKLREKFNTSPRSFSRMVDMILEQ